MAVDPPVNNPHYVPHFALLIGVLELYFDRTVINSETVK